MICNAFQKELKSLVRQACCLQIMCGIAPKGMLHLSMICRFTKVFTQFRRSFLCMPIHFWQHRPFKTSCHFQAVQELDKLLETPSEASFVREAVLRRLTDDDAAVISAVLSGNAIQRLCSEELSIHLSQLLERSYSSYISPFESKSRKKMYRSIIKQVTATACMS